MHTPHSSHSGYGDRKEVGFIQAGKHDHGFAQLGPVILTLEVPVLQASYIETCKMRYLEVVLSGDGKIEEQAGHGVATHRMVCHSLTKG